MVQCGTPNRHFQRCDAFLTHWEGFVFVLKDLNTAEIYLTITKKKVSKNLKIKVIWIFLMRLQMDEILPSSILWNAYKSEGRICNCKIFLRNGFYIVIITKMTN